MVYYNKTSNKQPTNKHFPTMHPLDKTPTLGSQYGFTPIAALLKTIPFKDRPPSFRRWDFWKDNRPNTIVLVYITIFEVDKLITFGGDALKLSEAIGRPVENYLMGDVVVPALTLPRTEMADLAAYCKLYRIAIEFLI